MMNCHAVENEWTGVAACSKMVSRHGGEEESIHESVRQHYVIVNMILMKNDEENMA